MNQHDFLEDFPWERRENSETLPNLPSEITPNRWSFDSFDDINSLAISFPANFFYQDFSSSSSLQQQDFNNYYFNEVISCPFADELSAPQFTDTPPFPVQEDYTKMLLQEDDQGTDLLQSQDQSKVEQDQSSTKEAALKTGICPERKFRGKQIKGEPSKNLMAERRRRKRLNDRLSMLRSIVPKISKMDRTAIVGDTVDYVKELLEKINRLQQEIEFDSTHFRILKDTMPNEFLVRNSPKFDVERRNEETQIEICCSSKPGLLLSTVTTLDALGLEIQQCVISCFNDFALQASCSEELKQRSLISSEDIKAALFTTAGYVGRCL
ncbi:transcription factor bHLH93-like [Mercurialis annua]|uniref:transcription factor bHLH93-like n=1 Tax=Mercurialis annua TaxID=3986 RepID=UPI00215DEFFA|nr:transcription factor bHLH93-like [Mercurialis annua]